MQKKAAPGATGTFCEWLGGILDRTNVARNLLAAVNLEMITVQKQSIKRPGQARRLQLVHLIFLFPEPHLLEFFTPNPLGKSIGLAGRRDQVRQGDMVHN